MKQELNRLVRLAGCGALLCGGVILAQDAKPAVPAAPPTTAIPVKHGEGGTANPEVLKVRELRDQIAAKEKAVLEKNAELKTAVDALDAQIKAKRDAKTPEARKEARELTKQRREKFAAVDPEMKELYAKQAELMRNRFGGKGPGGAKPEAKPATP
jgi:hypothetical protein